MQELAERFDEVMIDTPHVIVVGVDGGEASIYPDGSMFVKEVEGQEEAEAIVERVSEMMLEQ